MKAYRFFLFYFFLSLIGISDAFAHLTYLKKIRVSRSHIKPRIVFELSNPAHYKIFTLTTPKRLVVDLKNVALSSRFKTPYWMKNPAIRKIRFSNRPNQILRVVFDLNVGISTPYTFNLPAQFHQNERLVIDLKTDSQITQKPKKKPQPDFIIVIDPGHGGKDPGASGSAGNQEKSIVFKIAQRLYRKINAQPNMKAYLTRSGDYYLGLRQRLRCARRHKADLFISIHADAFRNASSHGASVYALSARGASSEAARWLAEKENASDLLGGIHLETKGHILKSVLIDLSQTASIDASLTLGKDILKSLSTLTKLHYQHVEQAGFVVLKSPDIPSLLIETGFLSNPREEKKLSSSLYQNKLATAILKGINTYQKRHRVQRS